MQNSEAGNRQWEKQLDVANLSFKDQSFKSKVVRDMLWIWGLPVPHWPPLRKILREIRSLLQDEKIKNPPYSAQLCASRAQTHCLFCSCMGRRDCKLDVCLLLLWLPVSDWSLSAASSRNPLISSDEKFAFFGNHLGRLSYLLLHSREY